MDAQAASGLARTQPSTRLKNKKRPVVVAQGRNSERLLFKSFPCDSMRACIIDISGENAVNSLDKNPRALKIN
jgi:hypothetical protein